MSRHARFIRQVVQDCREYAARYDCSLEEALSDWEGDGPEGSFGLSSRDCAAVATALGIELDDGSDGSGQGWDSAEFETRAGGAP